MEVPYPHLLGSTSQEGVPGSQGRAEGRPGGQGKRLKNEGGPALAVLGFPGPPGLPSGSFLGSQEFPPGRYFQRDEGSCFRIPPVLLASL